MSRTPKKNVIPQMFDVRPVNAEGGVDWDRIRLVGSSGLTDGRLEKYEGYAHEEIVSGFGDPAVAGGYDEGLVETSEPLETSESFYEEIERRSFRYRPIRNTSSFFEHIGEWRHAPVFRYAFFATLLLALVSGGVIGVNRMLSIKGEVLGESSEGIELSLRALSNLGSAKFSDSASDFRDASTAFSGAGASLGAVGGGLVRATQYFPFLSSLSSGQGLIEGAKHLSSAGAAMSEMLAEGQSSAGGGRSFLPLLDQAEGLSLTALTEIGLAQDDFSRVDPNDIPDDKRQMFAHLREKLPMAQALLSTFHDNSDLIRELLGENGPRAYLFLFQNNDELRATGGFIGSYGLLDVNQGRVRKFFIDGIFNPDGQLRESIVPPAPIQKVSAAWSLHDSNWYPDFPTSAEKAIFFYEKTGGPTTDGVVTFTPSVIQDLLRVTGPVDMTDYGVTVSADNFMPVVQEEVEVNYDKEENQPKKILADLAPMLLDRIFQEKSSEKIFLILDTLSRALNERQILLYSRNAGAEKLIDRAGWSGRLLDTAGDYVSVVHSNLNGFKTDGVIDESIWHKASIQADGSVLDTIRITRKHTGGNTPYDWWNRVNSDYLRVYVPLGSELISEKGATYEFPKAPLDYDKLGFKRDPNVVKEEEGATVDKSGTRILEESGKTVFGNWVYVSPGESVTVEYVYKLPFRVVPENDGAASYSLLFQKQAGVKKYSFLSEVTFPNRYVPIWTADGMTRTASGFTFDGTLATDLFLGAVFEKK